MSNQSVNKVILLGNVGEDPELNVTSKNVSVTTISVATNESWRDATTGDWQTSTEWHRVIAWGKLAEIANTHAAKGKKVYVEGSNKTRKYTDNQGIERHITEVHATEFKIL